MEIICNKKEFANLIITCDNSTCGDCVLNDFCESETKKLGNADKQEGFISICKIKEEIPC